MSTFAQLKPEGIPQLAEVGPGHIFVVLQAEYSLNIESPIMHRFCLRLWSYVPLLLVLVPSVASGQGIKRPTIPLTKAVDEIRRFEQAYADAFNKKDTTTVMGMYAPGAIFIQGDGSVLVGQDTIKKVIAANAPNWPQMTLEADTTRVVGQTAWVTGTVRFKGSSDDVNRYLIVYRRGQKYWKINALAVVPVRPDSAPPAKIKVSGDSAR